MSPDIKICTVLGMSEDQMVCFISPSTYHRLASHQQLACTCAILSMQIESGHNSSYCAVLALVLALVNTYDYFLFSIGLVHKEHDFH